MRTAQSSTLLRPKLMSLHALTSAAVNDPALRPGRYRTCDVCGQQFDTVDLDQVYHHGPEAHLPLTPRPASN